MVIELLDILKLAGFNANLPARVVRHQDKRYPVEDLRRQNWLELYQAYQSKNIFHGAKQIISFYGLDGNRAGFYGVYKVGNHHPAREGRTLAGCEWSQVWNSTASFFYDLERDRRFDSFRDRVVVDWPGRLWVQTVKNKPVAEILPSGRKLPPFVDYLEFSLTYAELQDLFNNEEAHRDWRSHLSAVAGVYLILAQSSGNLYVGSADGPRGIWGRWRDYANSGHGDNRKLKQLIEKDSCYPQQFRFSVLQILPKSMARKEVLRRESSYIRKLGTRATGLN